MNVLKSIGIITIIAVVTKVLGFLREALIAAYFGTSYVTNAYFVALTVPNLLFTAFGTAISAGLIPMYVELKSKDEEKAKHLLRSLGSLFLALSLVITVISFLFAPQITDLIIGHVGEKERDLTIYLTKITLPSFCFFVLSAFATGILNANKNFIIPSISTLPYNALIILFLLLFGHQYGIVGVTYCALFAAITQYVIQYPAIKSYGVGFTWRLTGLSPETKKALWTFLPIIVASLAVQVNNLTDQMVASRVEGGNVSALLFSSRLLYLPLSIIVASLITVFYPKIVDAAKLTKETFFDESFKGMKIILLTCIPVGVVMFVLNHEIIQIVYQRGEFDASATKLTAYSFLFYTPALFAIGLRDYFIRCFMAVERNKLTMVASIIGVAINVLLSIVLGKWLGNGGIALACSVAMGIQSLFFFWLLTKNYRQPSLPLLKIAKDLGKMVLLFGLTYLVTWGAKEILPAMHVYVQFVLVTGICFVAFGAGAWLLKMDEVSMIKRIIKK